MEGIERGEERQKQVTMIISFVACTVPRFNIRCKIMLNPLRITNTDDDQIEIHQDSSDASCYEHCTRGYI